MESMEISESADTSTPRIHGIHSMPQKISGLHGIRRLQLLGGDVGALQEASESMRWWGYTRSNDSAPTTGTGIQLAQVEGRSRLAVGGVRERCWPE